MRISKAKSVLKKQLQVEVSARHTSNTDVTVIDGSALLWVVHWPTGGTVKEEFVNNFRGHTERLLCKGDVYLYFERYHEYSTKSVTRGARITEAGRTHRRKANTLPPQKVVLTVTENKQQLMDIICTELIYDELFHHDHLSSLSRGKTELLSKALMELSFRGRQHHNTADANGRKRRTQWNHCAVC